MSPALPGELCSSWRDHTPPLGVVGGLTWTGSSEADLRQGLERVEGGPRRHSWGVGDPTGKDGKAANQHRISKRVALWQLRFSPAGHVWGREHLTLALSHLRMRKLGYLSSNSRPLEAAGCSQAFTRQQVQVWAREVPQVEPKGPCNQTSIPCN